MLGGDGMQLHDAICREAVTTLLSVCNRSSSSISSLTVPSVSPTREELTMLQQQRLVQLAIARCRNTIQYCAFNQC